MGIKGESSTPLRQKEGVELDEEVFVGRGWEVVEAEPDGLDIGG